MSEEIGQMFMRRGRVCSTAVSVLLLVAPAIRAEPLTRVDFRWSPQGRIEIPVKVDGIPGVFVVDTAAEWSAIGQRLAARMQRPRDVVRGREFVNDASLGFGGVVLRHQRLAVVPSDDSAEVSVPDGIIGADVMGRFVAEIDFDARTLSLWEMSGFRPRGYTAVPLHPAGWLACINVSLQLPGKRSPTRARLAVGTAVTTDILLGYAFANDQGVLDHDQQGAIEPIAFGPHSSAAAIRVPNVGIALARWAVDGTDSRALREPALSGVLAEVDGLIGLSALRRFKVAINYPQDTLYLRPGRGGGPLRTLK